MTKLFKSILFTAISLTLALPAARAEETVPFEGTVSLTATAAPNTGSPAAVYCGGSPLALVVEAHGNGYTSVGPLALFLQKTLDVPGAAPTVPMHGCVTLTAPNGDALSAIYDGISYAPNSNGFTVSTGTLTFTGGTGKFKNARGEATFTCNYIGLYPSSSFLGGTGAPLIASAFYSFKGHVKLHGDD